MPKPLGSPDDKEREPGEKLNSCTNAIAYDYATETTSQKLKRKERVMVGFLEK